MQQQNIYICYRNGVSRAVYLHIKMFSCGFSSDSKQKERTMSHENGIQSHERMSILWEKSETVLRINASKFTIKFTLSLLEIWEWMQISNVNGTGTASFVIIHSVIFHIGRILYCVSRFLIDFCRHLLTTAIDNSSIICIESTTIFGRLFYRHPNQRYIFVLYIN